MKIFLLMTVLFISELNAKSDSVLVLRAIDSLLVVPLQGHGRLRETGIRLSLENRSDSSIIIYNFFNQWEHTSRLSVNPVNPSSFYLPNERNSLVIGKNSGMHFVVVVYDSVGNVCPGVTDIGDLDPEVEEAKKEIYYKRVISSRTVLIKGESAETVLLVDFSNFLLKEGIYDVYIYYCMNESIYDIIPLEEKPWKGMIRSDKISLRVSSLRNQGFDCIELDGNMLKNNQVPLEIHKLLSISMEDAKILEDSQLNKLFALFIKNKELILEATGEGQWHENTNGMFPRSTEDFHLMIMAFDKFGIIGSNSLSLKKFLIRMSLASLALADLESKLFLYVPILAKNRPDDLLRCWNEMNKFERQRIFSRLVYEGDDEELKVSCEKMRNVFVQSLNK